MLKEEKMTIVMDAGYANAKLRRCIESSFCLVKAFQGLIEKDSRGRYKTFKIPGLTILDRTLIEIYMTVTCREGGDLWLERKQEGRYFLCTQAMQDAIDLYMKKKKLKKFTQKVIMD